MVAVTVKMVARQDGGQCRPQPGWATSGISKRPWIEPLSPTPPTSGSILGPTQRTREATPAVLSPPPPLFGRRDDQHPKQWHKHVVLGGSPAHERDNTHTVRRREREKETNLLRAISAGPGSAPEDGRDCLKLDDGRWWLLLLLLPPLPMAPLPPPPSVAPTLRPSEPRAGEQT